MKCAAVTWSSPLQRGVHDTSPRPVMPSPVRMRTSRNGDTEWYPPLPRMARCSRIGTRTGIVSMPVIFKSKYELQPELQLPRISRRQDLARSRRGQTRIRQPQVDVVQRVEHLPAELQIFLLGELEVLRQIAVQVA